MQEKERGRAGLWCTVILVALLSYVLGLAPACSISSRMGGGRVITSTYRPLTWFVEFTENELAARCVTWYSEIAAADGWHWEYVEDSTDPKGWRWANLQEENEKIAKLKEAINKLVVIRLGPPPRRDPTIDVNQHLVPDDDPEDSSTDKPTGRNVTEEVFGDH